MIGKTLAAIALTAVAGLGGAQQTGFYSDGRPERLFYTYSGLNNKDATFLKKAMAANNFEIESSRLALQNGSSSFVKEFAQKMIHDHTGAKEEVGEVAKQKSFSIPGELPPPLLSKMNQLRQLHGAAFDSAYRAAQRRATRTRSTFSRARSVMGTTRTLNQSQSSCCRPLKSITRCW